MRSDREEMSWRKQILTPRDSLNLHTVCSGSPVSHRMLHSLVSPPGERYSEVDRRDVPIPSHRFIDWITL